MASRATPTAVFCVALATAITHLPGHSEESGSRRAVTLDDVLALTPESCLGGGGGVEKTYGGSPWFIYSCRDGKSVIIVSAPRSPAEPYVFSYIWRNGRYHLDGRGMENKPLIDAAHAEIRDLSEQEIAALAKQSEEALRKLELTR